MSASSSGHLRFPGFDKNILDGLVLTGNRSNRNRQPGSLCGSIYGQNTTNSSFCFSNSLFQRAARTRRILAAKPRSFPDRSSNFGLTERCQGVRRTICFDDSSVRIEKHDRLPRIVENGPDAALPFDQFGFGSVALGHIPQLSCKRKPTSGRHARNCRFEREYVPVAPLPLSMDTQFYELRRHPVLRGVAL